MPLFTLVCQVCAHEEEVLCKFDEKGFNHLTSAATVRGEDAGRCPHDGVGLVWKGAETPTLDFNGNKSGRFQMKAITSEGQKVAGHFGKSARIK